MANHYKDVIKFLSFNKSSISHTDLVCVIAASHPKILMDAVRELRSASKLWKEDVLSYRDTNDKLKAIKIWREETGLGLKESKEAVEAYWRNN